MLSDQILCNGENMVNMASKRFHVVQVLNDLSRRGFLSLAI